MRSIAGARFKDEHTLSKSGKIIVKGAPHVIHNDEQREAYPSRSQLEAIELLTLLVERCVETHDAILPADAVPVVRFLLEQQDLTQRDLIPAFGSESAVSMFLTKQRKLTPHQVRKLSAHFKIPAGSFIQSR